MFLIPYIYEKKQSIYPVHIFHIFLNNGTLFLQMNNEDIEEFCNENGLFFKNKILKDDICFIELDIQKTNLKSFYFYTENVHLECFRRFILIGDYKEDLLDINDTNPEFIKPILKDILDIYTE